MYKEGVVLMFDMSFTAKFAALGEPGWAFVLPIGDKGTSGEVFLG